MVYNICVWVQVIYCNVLNTFPELVLIIVLITTLWIFCFKTDMLLMFVCIWKYVLETTWFSVVGAYGLVTYNYEASVCKNAIGNLQCETLQYLFFN